MFRTSAFLRQRNPLRRLAAALSRRSRLPIAVLMVVSSLSAATLGPQAALAASWVDGDVFTGVSGGSYKVFTPTGTFIESVTTSSGFTTGCAFDSAGNFYGTWFSTDNVFKAPPVDPHTLTSFGGGYSTPESIAFDAAGHVFVGNLGDGIREFQANGTLIKTVIDTRVDWFDIAADQDTILYTQEGTDIKRVSISTGMSLSNFTTGTATQAFALRILPDGGALLADRNNVKRYNAGGIVTQTYNATGEDSWFSLNLDPDGTSFWSGNFGSANFYKFNIATGAKELGPINTGTGTDLFGICVKGEVTVATGVITLAPATQSAPVGTNATVTATVTQGGNPLAGATVTIKVTSGPNVGTTGTSPTDVNGKASFTYSSTLAGTDTLQASFVDATGTTRTSNNVTVIWTGDPAITATGTTFNATEGQSVTGTVATFTDPDAAATAAEYSAAIDWGDGSPTSAGTITGPTGGPFTVKGTHTYKEEIASFFDVFVTITDVDNPSNSAKAHSTAKVADAAITAKCATPAVSNVAFSGNVATFTDAASPSGTLSDFTATIDWGDTTTSSPGTVIGPDGGPTYTVSGNHTYSSAGTFTIKTTIIDVGGSKADTDSNCQVQVIKVTKDYRFTNVAFGSTPNLGTPLPVVGGIFDLLATLNKSGQILNYNPGQYYAVSTVQPGVARANLFITESYAACVTPPSAISQLNPAPGGGGGSVIVVDVDPSGTATQIADANSPNVTFNPAGTIATVHLTSTLAGHTYIVYVKFAPGLIGQTYVPTPTCKNTNGASLSAGGPSVTATATLEVTPK